MDLIIGLTAGLLTLVIGFIYLPRAAEQKAVGGAKLNLAKILGYEAISKEAETSGGQLSTKEFLSLVFVSFSIGGIIALAIGNPFYILGGIVAGFYLPRFIVMQVRQKNRFTLLEELPDSLRIITARLMDYGSIPNAVEASLPDLADYLKACFQELLRSVSVGIPLEQAVYELSERIMLRKFTDYCEKLVMAHREGFNSEAIKSLEATINAIDEDLMAIKTLEINSKRDKQNLLMVVAMAWFFPIVLSFMNSANQNIFLDSLLGQILMFSFFIATIITLVKGEEYLSLKLDEL